MKIETVDKMIKRWDSLGAADLQNLLLRLVQQKGIFRQVFEQMREGLILFDEQGVITFANKAASEIFGGECRDLSGEVFLQHFLGLSWNSVVSRISPFSQDVEITYPDHRFLNFYLTPLDVGPNNDKPSYVMIIRDVTMEQKKTEEQIETEKLSALTLLAAGVAHEIGNPLNSLGLHLQILERRLKKLPNEISDSCLSLLEVASSEMKRLDIILKQFLHAIRPTQLDKTKQSLNKIIEETLNLISAEIKDRGIKVCLSLDKTIPLLDLDKDQMKQVFFNLIKNAYQSIPNDAQGSITINTLASETQVCVVISDTGSGISPERMGALYEPFNTTKVHGNGLGLLIVRRIIRDHGGSIRIESEVNVGTKITLTFPRSERLVWQLPAPSNKEK